MFGILEAVVYGIPSVMLLLWWISGRNRRKQQQSARLKVAGGRIPYFGNAFEFSGDILLDSEIRYSKMGDAVEIMLGGRRGIVINDVDLAHEVLAKRPKYFRRLKGLDYSASTLGMTSGIFHSNGATWGRMRRGTAPSFSIQNVKQQYLPILRQIRKWIQSLKDKSKSGDHKVFDMKAETFQMTMGVISAVTFGSHTPDNHSQDTDSSHKHPTETKPEHVEYFSSSQFYADVRLTFQYSIETLMSPLPRWTWPYLGDMLRLETETKAATDRFSHACRATIAMKRQQLLLVDSSNNSGHRKCLLDSLVTQRHDHEHEHDHDHDQSMTDEEIVANLKTFYLAGSDSTSAVLTWIVFVFSQYPLLMARVKEEVMMTMRTIDPSTDDDDDNAMGYDQLQSLQLTQATIKETLRLYGPIDGISGELEASHPSLVIGGDILIRQGELFWVNIDGIHRSEKYFSPDPMAFNPDRWLLTNADAALALASMEKAFFGFGAGPRLCAGRSLAMMEVTLATALLAISFDSFSLDCPVAEVKRVINFSNIANKMPMRLVPSAFSSGC